MSRNVLLARPHPFIVKDMMSVLAGAGMTPHRLHAADGRELTGYEPLCGAVISAALSAESPLSLVEAYTFVRSRWPQLPVAFSALAAFETIAPKLTRELALPASTAIVGVRSNVKAHPDAGSERLVLLFTDRDLAEQRRSVASAFVAHFRPS